MRPLIRNGRVAAAMIAVYACSSGTEPVHIDHVSIRFAALRPSYPIGDTVTLAALAFSSAGTWVRPQAPPVWHSEDPAVARVNSVGLVYCYGKGTATIDVDVDGVSAHVQLPVRGILHDTSLTSSQLWAVADTPHVVQGFLRLTNPFAPPTDTVVLTIEPGAIVRFRDSSGLSFGDANPAALRIPPGADPVIMDADSVVGQTLHAGAWVGIALTRGREELRNLTMRHCGASRSATVYPCLSLATNSDGMEALIDGLKISQAHDGLFISTFVTLTPGSKNLSVDSTDGHAVSIGPQIMGMFPHGGAFSGNAEQYIRILSGQVVDSATWSDVGVPVRLVGGVTFLGLKLPHLRLPAGMHLMSDPGGSLSFEQGGIDAGDLGAAPVVLESSGSGWGGISTQHASQSTLRNVILRDCGLNAAACLYGYGPGEGDSGIVVQDLTIEGARSIGLQLFAARFDSTSGPLTITGSDDVPLDLYADAVPFIPSGSYTGNGVDAIRVRDAAVWRTARWRDLGVPYFAPLGLTVDNSTTRDTLTLDPGVVIQFGAAAWLSVGVGTLLAVGTPADSIVLASNPPGVRGSWFGVALSGDAGGTRLDYVDLRDAGAGPATFSGALRLAADPGGVLRHSTIRHSGDCAIILFNGMAFTDDYTDPAYGNAFVDNVGPTTCQPPVN